MKLEFPRLKLILKIEIPEAIFYVSSGLANVHCTSTSKNQFWAYSSKSPIFMWIKALINSLSLHSVPLASPEMKWSPVENVLIHVRFFVWVIPWIIISITGKNYYSLGTTYHLMCSWSFNKKDVDQSWVDDWRETNHRTCGCLHERLEAIHNIISRISLRLLIKVLFIATISNRSGH